MILLIVVTLISAVNVLLIVEDAHLGLNAVYARVLIGLQGMVIVLIKEVVQRINILMNKIKHVSIVKKDIQ